MGGCTLGTTHFGEEDLIEQVIKTKPPGRTRRPSSTAQPRYTSSDNWDKTLRRTPRRRSHRQREGGGATGMVIAFWPEGLVDHRNHPGFDVDGVNAGPAAGAEADIESTTAWRVDRGSRNLLLWVLSHGHLMATERCMLAGTNV